MNLRCYRQSLPPRRLDPIMIRIESYLLYPCVLSNLHDPLGAISYTSGVFFTAPVDAISINKFQLHLFELFEMFTRY